MNLPAQAAALSVFQAVVIGGSFAGLSAALQLARARRTVRVIDAGSPRNRFAAAAHGVLGHDGTPGHELLAAARAQLLAYPHASIVSGRAVGAVPGAGRFTVQLEDGTQVTGRRLVLSSGQSDVLPELPGLPERWGATVLHCPYCHGYEIGGGAIGVLAASALSVHQALLVADWGDVTFFTQGIAIEAEDLAFMANRGIRVETVPVVALEGPAPALDHALLQDGRRVPLRAVFIGAPLQQNSPIAESLGCRMDDTPQGRIVRTDEWKLTSVAGIYAAGDMARAPSNLNFAMCDGMAAGIGLHRSLVLEDMQTPRQS
ncbi:MAG: NAD(P)/FAD-dependent oxidoreductase [Comamonadaceae bacterium]|nr:MAG: NAD(P)/FAD-dependent oxidoreductase [Comamonadaceae bacterium]